MWLISTVLDLLNPGTLEIAKVFASAYFAVHLEIIASAQPALTCTKLTIETLQQAVKYVQI